jgi:hypothetical protein
MFIAHVITYLVIALGVEVGEAKSAMCGRPVNVSAVYCWANVYSGNHDSLMPRWLYLNYASSKNILQKMSQFDREPLSKPPPVPIK